MIELTIGTYGVLCWLVFKKWKLVPTNAYTILTAILIALVGMGLILIMLIRYQPSTKDARLYAPTTPIMPVVRGLVVEVIPEGAKVKEGDVLFRIDPKPYQYAVDGLEAQLTAANTNLGQLEEKVKSATASTEQARANLLTSESDFDRQAREDLERASQAVTQAKSQAEFQRTQVTRYDELLKSGAVAQAAVDAIHSKSETADAELKQAEAAERQATEKIKSGGDRVTSAREAVKQAEAQERDARLAAETVIGGVNPEVRQIMAALDDARWNLAGTTVRAPGDGYVTQVILRRGQMATPFASRPLMVFIHDEKPTLLASLPQNVMPIIEVGQEVELAFKPYPGRIFHGKVAKILPIAAEGELQASGQLQKLTPASAEARIPFRIEYDQAVEDLNLPVGSQAYAAVYTEHFHVLSIVRKILLRIKGWENYLFMP